MKRILIICLMLTMIAGCKKKVDRTHEVSDSPAPVQQQQAAPAPAEHDDDATVWTLQCSYGTYDIHKVDSNAGIINGVTSDGYKIYVSPPYILKVKTN